MAALIVYDAKGHKRGAGIVDDQDIQRIEPEDNRQTHRSEADLERARATLPILPGILAVLTYACGCRSPQGICNHHSFSSGLALPDGLICGRCRSGVIIRVSKEIDQPARLA